MANPSTNPLGFVSATVNAIAALSGDSNLSNAMSVFNLFIAVKDKFFKPKKAEGDNDAAKNNKPVKDPVEQVEESTSAQSKNDESNLNATNDTDQSKDTQTSKTQNKENLLYDVFEFEYEQEKEAFVEAITYLKQNSPTAAKTIDELIAYYKENGKTLKILYPDNPSCRYVVDSYILYWDPKAGMKVLSTGENISPAVALLHELGHAKQQITGFLDRYRDKNGVFKITMKQRLAIEKNNLKNVEIPTLQELRSKGFKEGIRNDYKDAVLQLTKGPTSTKPRSLKDDITWIFRNKLY